MNPPSKQLRWKRAKLAAGLCGSCGIKPRINMSHCEECRDRLATKSRNAYRLKMGISLDRPVARK
jgi:hypothetical protein